MSEPFLVALVGNPNVGKSTVFNAVTGLNQHTGNWPGKTVDLFQGTVNHKDKSFRLVDLPGTYSLRANSREEEITKEFLMKEDPDVTVCVCDATSLERNLNLVLQVAPLTRRVILCLNLMDEASKRGLVIDFPALEKELGFKVVAASARKKEGMDDLIKAIDSALAQTPVSRHGEGEKSDEEIEKVYEKAAEIAKKVIKHDGAEDSFSAGLDDVLTSRKFGIPIMLLLLGATFTVTLYLANYPSLALFWAFSKAERLLAAVLSAIKCPKWLFFLLTQGIFRTVGWVASVMLPPMAIFFPLWTLLEDFGYLPRAAFNLDHLFKGCGGHGKQALTMSMGFGCNAAGVIACRIIESPRERLIALLTNAFVPCNGRFPMLIMLSSIFFCGQGVLGSVLPGLSVAAVVMVGIGATFLVSRILSSTLLKGVQSSFVLELPPYRKPDIRAVLVRSWKDRTMWVLWRALIVSAPCGALTWVLANVHLKGATLLAGLTSLLNRIAYPLGMDGTILAAFLLAFPANEIVLPVALMSYLSQGAMIDIQSQTVIAEILRLNGWTWMTALSTLIFTCLHYPCGTTVYTVYKETKSVKWAFMSVAIPTLTGIAVLLVLNFCFRIFGF